MKLLIEPALFNTQLVRAMGFTSYQGAEIGECLTIAEIVNNGDREVWYQTWQNFAQKNYKLAEDLLVDGLFCDAKNSFLRASNYYRTSFFFLEDAPNDIRIEESLKLSIDSFERAAVYFKYPPRKITINFDSIELPAYLYINTSGVNKVKPILIDTGGGDGTKEESYFGVADEALNHDMHCLCFEGPGQGSVLRFDKIPFIPDWERVIQSVVDYVISIPEVDQDNIFLIGRSFGGYLASRAVTKESRIAACIVDPGIFDNNTMEARFRSLAITKCPELRDAPLYQIVEHIMKHDVTTKFMLDSRKWRFGAKTVRELIEITADYTLDGLVEKINCPMLVCDNSLEYITPGQAKLLYNKLKSQKQYILFTPEDGTGGHCEPLAPRIFTAKMYQWLNTIKAY